MQTKENAARYEDEYTILCATLMDVRDLLDANEILRAKALLDRVLKRAQTQLDLLAQDLP